ncbi:MAG TPA: peptide chain release factor-like protein [Opitutaceae bacterium]|nr:peptide chain release factor-like protein [Opitutaceae bacterium]
MDLPTQIQTKLDAVGILASDVEERFVRGSGPGGQKINKTSSTVVLRHRPTGVEVRVQRERSQSANREIAWLELCEKISMAARAEQAERIHAREKNRRRNRTKSRAQKARMVAGKRHRSSVKNRRGRVIED